ncbi:MAG: TIGR02996 domain-containing protein [Planctomycetia bacterium]|nr:TIGR02996 domain-containing protein [Planctomycetia bacterium]
MTDADALLRAIIRHPEDDTPRLIYADWLQENGRSEEAEFIRVECRLATTTPDDPDYPALLDREEELRLWLSTHVPGPELTLAGGLSLAGGSEWWKRTLRGFPRFMTFEGYHRPGTRAMRALASALEKAFDVLPTRWLGVNGISVTQLATLVKQPVLERLSQLSIHAFTNEPDEVVRLLANCSHLKNLRGLSLGVSLSDAGCEALASAPWGELEWFYLNCPEITPAGLRALASTDWFRNLRELTLANTLLDETFQELCRLPAFPNLHTLELGRNQFPESIWQTFARSRSFPALTRLNLSWGNMSEGRLTALASANGFTLRALDLTGCAIGSRGSISALTTAPWAGSLRMLDLSYNMLNASEVKAIASCRKFTELKHLSLAHNPFGPPTLAAITANPALRGLRSLRLEGRSRYDNRGLTPGHFEKFLAKLDMPDLRHLDLSERPVGARAVRLLTDPRFSSLTRLGLRYCKLSDSAVAALIASPTLRNLIELDLRDNKLATGPERLADRSVLPCLASCSLQLNEIDNAIARKLRRRPGVFL